MITIAGIWLDARNARIESTEGYPIVHIRETEAWAGVVAPVAEAAAVAETALIKSTGISTNTAYSGMATANFY